MSYHQLMVLAVCAALAVTGGVITVLALRWHRLPRPVFRQKSRLETGETWTCLAGHEHTSRRARAACDRAAHR